MAVCETCVFFYIKKDCRLPNELVGDSVDRNGFASEGVRRAISRTFGAIRCPVLTSVYEEVNCEVRRCSLDVSNRTVSCPMGRP